MAAMIHGSRTGLFASGEQGEMPAPLQRPADAVRHTPRDRFVTKGRLASRLIVLCALLGPALVGFAQPAAAQMSCPVEGASIRILSNDFPALHAVNQRARECAGEGTEVEVNQTAEHKNIQVPALTANPAEYTVAVVANGSLVPLLNDGLIRPLDDLVEKYGQDLNPRQLVTLNGKVWAIAFMANAQHLFYREDVLAEAGVEPPKTYEEVLEAAKTIEEQGIMRDPLALNTGAGWHLGEEFVNMYFGMGGEFFEPGTAKPALNNETGVAALQMIKDLVEYSSPDFLTFDGNTTNGLWSAGKLALMIHWGSRAGQIIGEQTPAEIGEATVLAGMPTVGGNEGAAATLWWDGFTIAQNISDEDAEASFVAMVHAIQPPILEENSDKAVWLIDGYEPGREAVGVTETMATGAKPYPMVPYMNILHGIIGNELADFLQGSESAEAALADIEASYTAAAREQGYID